MNSRINTTIPQARTHHGDLPGFPPSEPKPRDEEPNESVWPIDVDSGLACAAVQQLEMDDRDGARVRMLYARHAAALWRYAHRLIGDRARADDVVQETLLRAWQHPEVVDEPERSPRARLFTVAQHDHR